MTAPAGSPGTASDGYRVEKPVGRHRAPPEPPPPDRWLPHIAASAALLTAASLIALAATAVAPAATAKPCSTTSQGEIPCPPPAAADVTGLDSVRPIARLVTGTSRPSPTSTATAPDQAAARTRPPSPSGTAPRSSSLPSISTGQPGSALGSTSVLETTLTRESPSPPDPTPTRTRTWTRTTRTTTPTSPASAATSSAPTTTEETPVTETEEPTPTDVLEEIVDEAVGEGA